MGQSNEYIDKYIIAKQKYIDGESLTQISKELHLDRGKLSNNLKRDGIIVVKNQNKTKFNDTYFDIINSADKAYWLGFLYADGAISSSSNTIEVSLQASDIHHLQKLISCLEYVQQKHIYCDDIRCRVQITNKHMKTALQSLGCVPKKSLILTFPTKEQVPDEYLFDFIRGYVDGDGSVMINTRKTGGRLSLLGTKEFIEGLLQRTGWKQTTIQHPSGAYAIEWAGKYTINYLHQLYQNANIYLDRKYIKYLQIVEICRL